MTTEWLKSAEAFKKTLDDEREFASSLGITDEVVAAYQRELFAGVSREDAFENAAAATHLTNHASWGYVRSVLENLPGPEDV
jgi:hypothetical protein